MRSALSTQHAALLVIVLLGLGLRLFGLGHGLPYQYVPDESTMVGGALRMGATRSLEPPTFIYPALLMYLFAAEYMGLLVVGRFAGLFATIDQFKDYAFVDPTLFYLLPRLAVALMGAAVVPLAYLLGKRLYGRTAGLVAAFLMATSLMSVQMSHQARHWAPVSLLTLVVLWVALDLAERGRRRDYWLSGLLVGLTAATSFNGFLLLAIPIVANVMWLRKAGIASNLKHPTRSMRHPAPNLSPAALSTQQPARSTQHAARSTRHPLLPILLTGALALAVFFALNPYILLQADKFVAFHSSGESSIGGQIRGHYDSYLQAFLERQGFAFFAEASLAYEPAITLLGIAGAILAVRRHRSTAPLVLIYPLFHYIMFSTTSPSFEQRYMLPALAVLALPAGLAASEAWNRLDRRMAAAMAVVLAILVALPALRYDWLLSQPDTRTVAKSWIEDNIPAGADLAVESYPPPVTADLESLRLQNASDPGSLGTRDQWVLDNGLPPGEKGYRLTRLNLVDTTPSVDHLSPYLAANPHRYVVVTDFRWKQDHLGHQALKAYLASKGRLLQTIAPGDEVYVPSDMLNNMEDPPLELWRVARPGPLIRIYEVVP